MKIQDLVFGVVFLGLLYIRKPNYFITAGLVALILAVPLFGFWIFFTAERLTWYAAVFFLTGTMLLLRPPRQVQ